MDDIKDDVLDRLDEATEQLTEGGPTVLSQRLRTGVSKIPCEWCDLMSCLDADELLQRTLPGLFAGAVARCAQDLFMGSRLSRSVVQASLACDMGPPSSPRGHKRSCAEVGMDEVRCGIP